MSSTGQNPETSYPVLYRDEHLLIINKPEGVLSHPNPVSGGERRPGPKAAFLGKYDFDREIFRTSAGPVWLLHRLDQDTSGILAAALDGETAKKCKTLFEERAVAKKYSALIAGRVARDGAWTDHLSIMKKDRFVRGVVLRGRPANAELTYRLEKFYSRFQLSLLEINLLTGRTHQIRVQAASRGCPVAGDEIYGDFALNKELRRELGLRRLFLHAGTLEMNHPVTGRHLVIRAPLPEKLRACIEQLNRT